MFVLSLHLKEYDAGGEVLRLYSELTKIFTAALFLCSHHGSTFTPFLPLCIYMSEKSPEREGSGDSVDLLCSQEDSSSLAHSPLAHETNGIVGSNIFLG